MLRVCNDLNGLIVFRFNPKLYKLCFERTELNERILFVNDILDVGGFCTYSYWGWHILG